MNHFIMLTRLSHGTLRSPKSLEELERQIMDKIRTECPDVEWLHNYAVLGPYDYLDIFRAPDLEAAFKIATIVRTFGHADTEVWAATEWDKYKDMVRHLPAEKE